MESNTQGTTDKDKIVKTGEENANEDENLQPPVGSEHDIPIVKTTDKDGESKDDEDPLKRLETLQTEKDVLEKRHKDAERKITELGQDRSNTQKNFEKLSESLLDLRSKFAEATKEPLPSTEEFIKAINEKGVEPIMDLIKKSNDERFSKFETTIDEKENRNQELELEVVKLQMASDTANYPDFNSLWPEMQKLARQENTAVNYDAGTKTALSTLYKLVKSDHSGDAIAAAEKAAAERKDAQLAKEANAGTAGGGKKGSNAGISDAEMKAMPTAKLKELVKGLHGIADRD